MKISGKTHHHFDGKFGESAEGKRWVITGISLCSPIKPISLSSSTVSDTEEDDVQQDQFPTTPTGACVKIPTVFPCPPAPKKRKPSYMISYGGAKEFFSPPYLETVFILKAT